MPAAIDIANVASASITGSTTLSVNVTCAAADNGLIVLVGADDSVAQAPPLTVTYNAVSLAMLGHLSLTSNYRGDASIWYLANPTTGSALQLLATYTNNSTTAFAAAPLSGVNTAITPVIGTGASAAAGTTASCSVTGAGANDVQLATCFVRAISLVSAGAGQTHIITPINNFASGDSFAADYILGSSAGNFSWTLPSGNWIAIGVTVFGLGGAPSTRSVTRGITSAVTQTVTGAPL